MTQFDINARLDASASTEIKPVRSFAVLPVDDPLAWRPDCWDDNSDGFLAAADTSAAQAPSGWDTADSALPVPWEAFQTAEKAESSSLDPWWDDMLKSLDELAI